MPNLDDIPPELLARICSYLPTKFMRSKFLLVCKRFYVLFQHQEYWRSRLLTFDPSLRFSSSTITRPGFRWDRTCAIVEQEQCRWTKPASRVRQFTLSDGHIATVDAVHLMERSRICISGSHDRCVCVWTLSCLAGLSTEDSPETNNCLLHTPKQGHDGWVWTITSRQDLVYTGAWDQKIVQWQLTPTELRPLSAMKCTGPVLCVVVEQDAIIASTFDRQVKFFDVRDPHNIVATLKYHTKPVLSVATDNEGRFVYSCSEDKKIVCFDRRAAAVVRTLQLDDYGVAISCNDGQLWIGDMKGKLHLLDPDLNILTRYDLASQGRVTDVKQNGGCLISMSHNKGTNIRVSSSGTRPRPLADFRLAGKEPAKMDYNNGVLACGFVDCSVRVWIPENVLE